MIQIPGRLRSPALYPVWIAVLAALIVLPGLGAYGFWEPEEIEVAARALPKPTDEASAGEGNSVSVASPKSAGNATQEDDGKVRETEPPLRTNLMKTSISALGVGEGPARLPFALLAILTVLGTYLLALRTRGPRAGAIAALVLLSCPLFIFQARQVVSHMGAMCGGVFVLVGVAGLCHPQQRFPALVVDGLAIALGGAIAYASGGPFQGLLPLCFGATLAIAFSLMAESRPGTPRTTWRLSGVLTIFGAMSVVFGLWVLLGAFEWTDVDGDVFSIGGKMFRVEPDYQPLLGGVWRTEGDLQTGAHSALPQIVFGLFPWIIFAPVAVIGMASGGRGETRPASARLLFGWAACAWLISTISVRKLGGPYFAAVPAVAACVAVWLDEQWAETSEHRGPIATPLVLVLAFFALAVLGSDLKNFPERFLSVHLEEGISKFPVGVNLHKLWLILALLVGLLTIFGLAIGGRTHGARGARFQRVKRLIVSASRHAVPAALVTSSLLSLFLAQRWLPRLSEKLSSKEVFQTYKDLAEDGEPVGLLGTANSASSYYAGDHFETLINRNELIRFLNRDERVFALVRASELCPLHRDSSGKSPFSYYVVDDSNADKIMLSNRLWSSAVPVPKRLRPVMQGLLDKNPLTTSLVRERPTGMMNTADIEFEGQLRLIGYDIPREVSGGEPFEAVLYYEVLRPISRSWQVFVHFDGSGRFNGDHWPVKKRCTTNYWQPGTFVIDRFTVDPASGAGRPRGTYKVFTGLFYGSSGNWTNMAVSKGDPDSNNRVLLGTINVR